MNKTPIKILIFLVIFLLITGGYYLFFYEREDKEAGDPLFCEEDIDCTYYNVLSCYNAKPINKTYKKGVLKITESEDSLCGEIKTACQNNLCIIEK